MKNFIDQSEKDSSVQDDDCLDEFLAFLERDINTHPERLVPFSLDLRKGVDELIRDIDVDLNLPLEDELDD
ncbi:type II toxin-antitoxin system PrlF family antitoxin [Vibrio furnissii]|uniref:type II toxin-antitoxin system PrlF family antitoxin n=1 Tax=Vibrio furnissii TaxID=29494 RepID=UPI001EEBE96B|nr:type II toxin-antitoxin system PrlF family antitoxin [Vibrio furnissii]MCG6231511.1 type II toxin-antitoxin system PrlF family antitoxin [Vibrio furnissii]MCG6261436.1 type II toxin-antitoxin system PrlF family antitoxin [Vibrio furnissii]